MQALLLELLDLLLPPCCAVCGGGVRGRVPVCTRCRGSLHPIPAAGDAPGPFPELDACVAEIAFEPPGSDWIHRFKYPKPGLAGLDPAARALVVHLARRAADRAGGPPPDLVIPVPLHPRAARRRGFQPAGLLAAAIARDRGLPWDPLALRRLRETVSQTGLTRRQRRANVEGVFRARGPLPQRIWLVDDVVTTGATLGAAARAARHAGAREVVAVCVAHTPAPRS